jgi:hypothetical protein
MEILADASNRSLMVVAPSGTGKSVVLRYLNTVISRDRLWLDSLTVNGFRYLEKQLKSTEKSILVDDLSKGGTEYSQIMTVCSLGELIYTGYIKKYTAALALDIEGFRGSAIMNLQPLILKRVLRADEFETDIRDKVIRFYHLRQPINISQTNIIDGLKYGYKYAEVEIPSKIYDSDIWYDAIDLFGIEFKKARSEEHLTALIRASATVNGRKTVDIADVWLVNEICRCFHLERELFEKKNLEGERLLDVNIIPILSFIATFGEVPVEVIMAQTQVKKRRIYEILGINKEWVRLISNGGEQLVIPTPECRMLLEDMGEL